MARYVRQGTNSSIDREPTSPELELIGDKLLDKKNRSPSVLDYQGTTYQHTFQSPLSTNSITGPYFTPSTSPIDDGCRPPASSPQGYFDDEEVSGNPDGSELRYPSPPSRPQSGRFEKKPLPGIRQESIKVRDVLAEATNVQGQERRGLFNKSRAEVRGYLDEDYHRSPSVMTDLDPDNEPISDVLSRLGDYTQNFAPDGALACIKCNCDIQDMPLGLVADSDSDDNNSGSDEEEEGVTLSMLLKMFQQYEEKGHSSVRYKAMTTLLHGYSGPEMISTGQLSELMLFLKTSLPAVQIACLTLLRTVGSMRENLQKILDSDILDFLYDCVTPAQLSPLAASALLLLEVIFSCDKFKDTWLGMAVTKFTPAALRLLRGNSTMDVKYGACCMFKALAKYEEFIGCTTEDVLPSVVLLRDESMKCRCVYVDILMSLLSHTDRVPPDLLDSSAIPVATSVICDGPCTSQCAALSLLISLTFSGSGVAMVIGTNNLIPMILCCMQESRCRAVRLSASQVMRQLCTTRKLGLCKDFMLQLASYFVPSHEHESLTSLQHMVGSGSVAGPGKPKFDEAEHMWQGIERFIDMTKDAIYREAKVEVDEIGVMVAMQMKPGVDTSPEQLELICHALHVLQNMCLWPLGKSRLGFTASKVDLTTFTNDDRQRVHLSKVNRGLTQAIWDKIGTMITELLYAYAQKFSKANGSNSSQGGQLTLHHVFEAQEVELVQSMLELLLCSAICTCVAFPEILPKLNDKSKRTSKSQSKLKSSSASHVQNVTSKTCQVQARLKSQSDVGSRLNSQDKVWVSENPHLTSMRKHKDTDTEHLKAELQEKEACTERRLLRKCLYEAGVFSCVCPFLQTSDKDLQVLVLQIFRCLIQPLEEKVSQKMNYPTTTTAHNGRKRPQTAMTRKDVDKRMTAALSEMSPDIADLIKAALGPQPGKATLGPQPDKAALSIPKATRELETIHERLQEFTEANPILDQPPEISPPEDKHKKPVFDRFRPVAQQCREAMLDEVGGLLLRGIFNRNAQIKKQCVLLMHDLVQHGDRDTHMRLSALGSMPKLVDFLRVNEDDELLEITGLIIVRILISSDSRLKNLFNRHGGSGLLIAMAGYTGGLLKQEVACTLKSVSRVDTPTRKRPMSAPVSRKVGGAGTGKPPDIWDHIQARWNHEDQVVGVLRQWIH